MITEFTKPWNNTRVWLDSDEPAVFLKGDISETTKIMKFKVSCNVSYQEFHDTATIHIYYKDGKLGDPSDRVVRLNNWEGGDVYVALCKAFTHFDIVKNKRFLCPSCKYGQRLRICHEHPHYGEEQYVCKDMSELKRNSERRPTRIMDGDTVIMECPPSVFDYKDGPGGWDGGTSTCPNYVKNEKPTKEKTWTVTTNDADPIAISFTKEEWRLIDHCVHVGPDRLSCDKIFILAGITTKIFHAVEDEQTEPEDDGKVWVRPSLC